MNDELKNLVKDLGILVSVPSVSSSSLPHAPFGEENRRALDIFLSRAAALGLKTGEDDGYAGWAEYGNGELRVGILAHLDVVPAGDNWTTSPYELSIRNGIAYGRGVSDDKGPLLACLYAMARLAEEKYKLRGRVRLIAGCNEEEGSACIKHYVSHCEIPRASFTPDSDFPVTASEKGIAHIRVTLPYCSETASSLIELSGGMRPNIVPDHCRAVIRAGSDAALRTPDSSPGSDVVIIKNGVPAHGSTPEKGDNAIIKMLPLLAGLLPGDTGLRAAAKLFSDLDSPARLGLGGSDVTGKTTLNVGMCGLENGRIVLTLDLRLPARYSCADVTDALRAAMPPETAVDVLHSAPALVHDENGPLVRTLMDVYRKHTGDLSTEPLHIGGGTYAKELPGCVAFGAVFPGTETHMHEADESYPVDDMKRLIDIYHDAIIALDSME